MNFEPVIMGVAALAIIGAFHPIVIKAEYHFSHRIWPAFGTAGLLLLAASVFLDGLPAYIVAFLGVTCLWSVVELFHQKRRVEKGWYPKKPGRK